MWLGKANKYYWLVSKKTIPSLVERIKKNHEGMILHIASFDSGPILPTADEIDLGWSQTGEIMVSPPLSANTDIPYDQFDEWYISNGKLTFPGDLELFVNYGGFTLVSPAELTRDDDPTWESGRWDYLYSMQERFWHQMSNINPESYVSLGELDILVSKSKSFIEKLAKNA